MKKRFISRLLTKELKVRRWVWVLEAQENSGDGWPHWHILIDVADLPGVWYNKESRETQEDKPENRTSWCYIPHFFDLNRVHRLLRKWQVGEQCKLTVKRENFSDSTHAIRYITKYLIKTPERGFPPWMLKHSRLRFIEPSRAVGSLGGEKGSPSKSKDDSEKKPRKKSSIPIERIAECNKKLIFSYYDPKTDKNVFTEPIPALKESIQYVPGGVSINDFDFKTQKSFTSWGFKSIKDLLRFQDIWNIPKLKDKLKEKITRERETLLSCWHNSFPVAGNS